MHYNCHVLLLASAALNSAVCVICKGGTDPCCVLHDVEGARETRDSADLRVRLVPLETLQVLT